MENKNFGIIMFSVLIEGIITYLNQFFIDGVFSWKILISIFLGIIISVAYNLDLPKYFNINSKVPYVGCIITGILLSRGSNYIFDLLEKFPKS